MHIKVGSSGNQNGFIVSFGIYFVLMYDKDCKLGPRVKNLALLKRS